MLNVNDNSLGNFDVLDFDELIRNIDGVWAHDFTNNIYCPTIFHTQLMTLYHYLCMV